MDSLCPLDKEQQKVCEVVNTAEEAIFHVQSAAGVGKTMLLHILLYGLVRGYEKKTEGPKKVALVLLPSRELREDLAQDILGNNKFK